MRISVRSGRSRRWIAVGALFVAFCAVAVYPIVPQTAKQGIYLAFSWLALVPVLYGMRHGPRNLQTQWRLIFAAILLGAFSNSIHFLLPDAGGILDTVASLLLLGAAVSLVVKRGRNDYSGLIDTSVAALVIGGLLWVVVLHPRMSALGLNSERQASLAAIVLLLSGTLGALVRLVDTDERRTRALRLLLLALALNLAGFVLQGWGGTPARNAAEMSFLAAYIALSIVGFDPSMRWLGQPGRRRQERLGPVRLALLGLAIGIPALVSGGLAVAGQQIDGAFIFLIGLVIVPLVMVRIGILAASRDQLAAALAHEANHDPLTGVLNRRAFTELLIRELRSPLDCTLVFCDLDGFKQVNDRYGHAVGDRLLTETAARLRQSTRSGDLVGRFGGDEFVILLRDCGADRALGAVERVRSALAEPFDGGVDRVGVGASVGAAVSEAATRDEVDVDGLVRVADEAMYAQKRHGIEIR